MALIFFCLKDGLGLILLTVMPCLRRSPCQVQAFTGQFTFDFLPTTIGAIIDIVEQHIGATFAMVQSLNIFNK